MKSKELLTTERGKNPVPSGSLESDGEDTEVRKTIPYSVINNIAAIILWSILWENINHTWKGKKEGQR